MAWLRERRNHVPKMRGNFTRSCAIGLCLSRALSGGRAEKRSAFRHHVRKEDGGMRYAFPPYAKKINSRASA